MFNYKEKLKEIFLKFFQNIKEDDFSFDKDRFQFENWDSLTHMQLISEAESIFEVNFEMDEVVDINRPQDLLDLILKKKNV